jgi:flagella basal body P-ring formation protein FlgA
MKRLNAFDCTTLVQTSDKKKNQESGKQWQTIRKTKAASRKTKPKDKIHIQPPATVIRRVRAKKVTIRNNHRAAAAEAATPDNSKRAERAVTVEPATAAVHRQAECNRSG